MALRRALALGKPRLFDRHLPPSPPVTPDLPPNPAATNFLRRHVTSPENSAAAGDGGVEFLYLPAGDELQRIGISCDRSFAPAAGLSAREARKVLRVAEVEKVRAALREVPEAAIPYADFVRICGGDGDRGLEIAKLLDDSGSVIVLGSAVYLRPDQVAKSMEAILAKTVSFPGDPRRRELEEMERQKSSIDERARAQVRGEMYCGLGFLGLQTLGFMRLTFWDLSWDVMEPICFFVTSLHFAGAYVFFLRTATEPSFFGYFRRRFETKQRRLMELHGFDFGRYEELRRACRGSISADRFRDRSLVGVVDRRR